jgi:hypothetical protein
MERLDVVGMALAYWSRQLSAGYNAWTTTLRERHPNINPLPTLEMRELNTKIMTWLFRLLGAFFVILSILTPLSVWDSK